MSFLFIENEANGFVGTGDAFDPASDHRSNYNTDGTSYDTSFSRGANSGSSGTLGASWYMVTPATTNDGVIHIHWRSVLTSTGVSGEWFFKDLLGTDLIWGKMTGSELTIAENPTATSWIILDFVGVDANNKPYDIDVEIDTVTGEFSIYLDGVKKFSDTNNGLTSLDPTKFNRMHYDNTVSGRMSEMILTHNISTLGMRVLSMPLDTVKAGNPLAGDITSINEVNAATDSMNTTGFGDCIFTVSDIPSGVDLSSMVVDAVTVSTIVDCTDKYEYTVAKTLVGDGTNTTYGSSGLNLDTNSAKTSINEVLTTNPITGNPWEVSDLNKLEVGINFEKPPLFSITVGKSSSAEEYGYHSNDSFYVGDASVGGTLSDHTSSNYPYGFFCYQTDNEIVLQLGTGGGDKFSGKNEITLRLVAEDSTEVQVTMPWNSSTFWYVTNNSSVFNFFKTNHNKSISVFEVV